MADAGFFKVSFRKRERKEDEALNEFQGTSAEQDSRFANKQKKLLKQMKFPDNIDVKVKNQRFLFFFEY